LRRNEKEEENYYYYYALFEIKSWLALHDGITEKLILAQKCMARNCMKLRPEPAMRGPPSAFF
jgi:hypothetical protein